MQVMIVLCLIASYSFVANTGYAQPLNNISVAVAGEVIAVEDISAIAKMNDFIIIAADEAVDGKNYLQFLRQNQAGTYVVDHNILLFSGAEMDTEALAVEKNIVYAIGSHSSKRKKTKPYKSYKKNARTFNASDIKDEPSRDQLYRLALDHEGEVLTSTALSLHDLLDSDPVFTIFSKIPSKENGVDIEGLAIKDGWLYVGFRGPVFRGNHVPVLRLQFDGVAVHHSILYVRLGGRGIRGMTEVAGGFLLLTGPVGDGDGSYALYFWDGNTMLAGKKRHGIKRGFVRLLANMTPPQQKKAEGIVLMQENANSYQLMIGYDGATGANDVLTSFVVQK